MIETPKILCICSWYPNRVHPYNGNFIEKHVRLLRQFAQACVLHAQEDPSLGWGKLAYESLDDANTLIVYYGVGQSKLNRIFKIVWLLRAYWLGWRKLSFNTSFEFIHLHVIHYGGILAWLLHVLYGLPLMITEHSCWYDRRSGVSMSAMQLLFARLVTSSAKCVMPVSEQLAAAMQRKKLYSNYVIIPNVVDDQLFKPCVKKESNRLFRFIHISTVENPIKNVNGIIDVIQWLWAQRQDFSVTIVGEGSHTELRNKITRCKLPTELINLVGPLSEKAVSDILCTHDALIHFSWYESQGVTLLEAQCCGLPVLATRVGGMTEIITDDRLGLLVDPGDKDAFLVGMHHLIDHKDTYDTAFIRAHALRKYGTKAVSSQLFSIFDSSNQPQ